jgi:hypothetical protein
MFIIEIASGIPHTSSIWWQMPSFPPSFRVAHLLAEDEHILWIFEGLSALTA